MYRDIAERADGDIAGRAARTGPMRLFVETPAPEGRTRWTEGEGSGFAPRPAAEPKKMWPVLAIAGGLALLGLVIAIAAKGD